MKLYIAWIKLQPGLNRLDVQKTYGIWHISFVTGRARTFMD